MKKIKNIQAMFTMFTLTILTFAFNACEKEPVMNIGTASKENANVIVDWYELQLKMTLNASPAISPLIANRSYGFIGVALYESVRPGIKNSISLSQKLLQMPAMPMTENGSRYSWSVSANATLAKLVAYFYPVAVVTANQQRIDSLETAYNETLKLTLDAQVFVRSQTFGIAVAEAIINWSQSDNLNLSNADYTPPVFPGSWVPTSPANGLSPYFGNTRPFIEESLQHTSPSFVYTYSEELNSDFYKMVKDMYDNSKTLTTDQKNIALYWNDAGVGVGYLPPGHSVSILTQTIKKEKSNLADAAVACAKTGISLHDAIIACWKSKYEHNLLRPITYIKKNIDDSWAPVLGTPPFPEYPAAHAFITAAFMETMTNLYGNNHSFTDNTYQTKYGGARTYTSFNAAAEECGMSRYFGGIHYLPSITNGLKLGKEVGTLVNNIKLTPSNDH